MSSPSITFKCKVSGSDDLRRRTVPLVDDSLAFATLRETVSDLFQLGGVSFKLLWRDEDEDLVTLGTDADVDEAVRCALTASRPTLRLEIKLAQVPEPAPAPVDTSPPPAPVDAPPPPHPTVDAQTPQNCSAPVDLQQMVQNQLTQLAEHLPQLEKHAKFAARRLEKQAKQWHKHVPDQLKHKADGLCKFLKKTKKNKNKKLHMKFVADLSLPDGTELVPGVVISKTWRVINSGSETWPDQSRLIHVGSDLFEGARPSAVPCLEPGTETELSLDEMIVPAEPGRYMSHWRLCTPEGNKYGDRLWFDVTVISTGDTCQTAPPSVHLGIACDVTGMNPIVGPRFKKFTEDYDLCQDAYDILDMEEKSTFRMINTPEDAARVAAEEEEHAAELAAAAEAEEQDQMEPEPEAAEAEAARVAAEAEAARVATEAEAARVATEAARVATEAEAARVAAEAEAVEAAALAAVPTEWQSSVQALKDMGFSFSVACDSILKAEGDLGAALEAALN